MMRRHLLALGLAVSAMAVPALAQLQDPTRPSGAPIATEAGSPAAAESGVQTVILRPGGKSAAVINGQYVVLGGKFGDKRVLRISESEVVLQGESGREVIRVTPAIEKVPTRKTAGKAQRTTGTTDK